MKSKLELPLSKSSLPYLVNSIKPVEPLGPEEVVTIPSTFYQKHFLGILNKIGCKDGIYHFEITKHNWFTSKWSWLHYKLYKYYHVLIGGRRK